MLNEIQRLEKLLNKLNRLLNTNQSGGASSAFDQAHRERLLREYIDSKLYGKNLSGVRMLTIIECNIGGNTRKIYLMGEDHSREQSCEDLTLDSKELINNVIKEIVEYSSTSITPIFDFFLDERFLFLEVGLETFPSKIFSSLIL